MSYISETIKEHKKIILKHYAPKHSGATNDLLNEATKILKKDRDNFAMRSCWKCNGAHEHLKECEIPLLCFECGKWYFMGVDITE